MDMLWILLAAVLIAGALYGFYLRNSASTPRSGAGGGVEQPDSTEDEREGR